MAGYSSAPSLGNYGNINASNYGQYNNQGYDTSGYGYSTAPSMSLAKAAWINMGSSNGLRSPYAGTSNLEYMSAVSQRAQLFWDQAKVQAAGATAFAASSLSLNAGSAFMQVGQLMGVKQGVNYAAMGIDGVKDFASYAAYHGAETNKLYMAGEFYSNNVWKEGFSGQLGRRMYGFGRFGEHGFIPQKFWKGGMRLFSGAADNLSAPFSSLAERAGDWVANTIGKPALSTVPGETLGGYIEKAAGGNIEALATNFTGGGEKLFVNAASYARKHGVASTLIKGGTRIAGGLAGTMAYFTGVDAALNIAIGGMTNMASAGDVATADASLTFQTLKGKIFTQGARDDAKRQADTIAKAIQHQVINETGISGAGNRFLFGHKLDGAISKKTALFGMFAEYGLTGKSNSGEEFVKKAQELEKAVKSLSRTFQKTTSEAVDMVRVMKSQGISNDNLISSGRNISLTSAIAGYSPNQVMSIQSHGSEGTRGTFLSQEFGVGTANEVMQRTAFAGRNNPGWRKTLFALRGEDSLNVFATRENIALANSANVRKMLIASMYEKQGSGWRYTGVVNQDALNAEMSGRGSYLSSAATNELLVGMYQHRTASSRVGGDMAIQKYMSGLNAGDSSRLIGAMFKSQGYASSLEGYAAHYRSKGLTPRDAMQLAKAQTKDISNDLTAEIYKADAIRQLNNRAGGGLGSTSLFGLFGSNLDMGIASTLSNFAGSISDRVFGKRAAGIGEASVGFGLATGMFAPAAFGATIASSIIYGADNANTIGAALLGGGKGYGYGARALAAGGASALSNAGTLSAGMAGLSTAGVVGAAVPIASIYAGSSAGAWAAKHGLKAMYGKNFLRDHKVASMGAYTGGAVAATMAGLAVATKMGLALGPWGWVASGAAATGMGLLKYAQDASADTMLRQRRAIVGAARGVSDLSLLQGTDLYNTLQNNYVKAHQGALVSDMSLAPLSAARNNKFNREMGMLNKAMADEQTYSQRTALLDNFIVGNSDEESLAGAFRSFRTSGLTLYEGLTNISHPIDSARGVINEAITGSLNTAKRRRAFRAIRRMYNQGNAEVKERILKAGSDYTSFTDANGVAYRGFKQLLESSSAGYISVKELVADMGDFNKKYGLESDNIGIGSKTTKGVIVSVGGATGMASALNALGKLAIDNPNEFKSIYGNASNARLLQIAEESGVDAEDLYNLALRNSGDNQFDVNKINEMARELGGIAINNQAIMLRRNTREAVLANISADKVSTVTSLLGTITSRGKMSRDIAGKLAAAVKGEKGRYARALGNMAKTSMMYVGQASQLHEGGTKNWAEYKKLFGRHAMSKDMYDIAAGSDEVLTSKELADFGSIGFVKGQLGGINAEANMVSPQQAMTEIVDNIKKIEANTNDMARPIRSKSSGATTLDNYQEKTGVKIGKIKINKPHYREDNW